jgi:predicted RNA binding protein YcfA (HicA-like mRNA interferase family)
MVAPPSISGRKVVKVFQSFGWRVARQRGSHIVMVKEGQIASLSIPDHDEVAKGTLRSLLRAAGLSIEEFTKRLES